MQLATFFPRYLANCIGQAWPHLLYALQRDEPSVQQTPIQIPKPTVVYFQYTNLFLVRWTQCLKNQPKSSFLHICDFLRDCQILIFWLFFKERLKMYFTRKIFIKNAVMHATQKPKCIALLQLRPVVVISAKSRKWFSKLLLKITQNLKSFTRFST